MRNKPLEKYKINIFGLDSKVYTFDFFGDNSFFETLEQDLIKKGKFEAKITVDKSETMIQMLFDIKAWVTVICDRSLEEFVMPFETKQKIHWKFGSHYEELSEELYIIPQNTQEISVAEPIFEFIALQIPIKKLHPRFMEEEQQTEENILIYSTWKPEEKEKESVDPRWAKLETVKNNK